jgi:transposase
MSDLRKQVIKLAHDVPELRVHLVPMLREAMEFDTPEALKKYLKEHPDADKSKHHVKKDSPSWRDEYAERGGRGTKRPRDEFSSDGGGKFNTLHSKAKDAIDNFKHDFGVYQRRNPEVAKDPKVQDSLKKVRSLIREYDRLNESMSGGRSWIGENVPDDKFQRMLDVIKLLPVESKKLLDQVKALGSQKKKPTKS